VTLAVQAGDGDHADLGTSFGDIIGVSRGGVRRGETSLSANGHPASRVESAAHCERIGRRTKHARRSAIVRSYAEAMPMPKRSSVDDFFAQLNDVQRPHLEALRELSLDADSAAREELKWNLPVYVRGEKTNLWMLQNFKHHCSLRFPPPFFATHKAAVESAGSEAGEGFVKLPYDRELPTELLEALMRARVEEYETTGAGWNDR